MTNQPIRTASPAQPQPQLATRHEVLEVITSDRLQLCDITALVEDVLVHSRITQGNVTVASRHTTAAIVLQENEPLLLQDMCRFLHHLAPEGAHYCHNDLARRPEAPPQERPNGHSHLQALVLPSSVQLVIADGRLDLGCWQRLFLTELDGPRRRQVSVLALGLTEVTREGVRLVAADDPEVS